MPYGKVSEAPPQIQELDGVKLTLAQVNGIAAMADAIKGDYAWPTAISSFKKRHKIEDGKWVKKEDAEPETLVEIKEVEGRYEITTISTMAIPDLEDEIFSTDAMDFDIKMAQEQDDYPEFFLFHKKSLPIGKVTEMKRVGLFMIDKGYSYDDPFSKEVCQKMLVQNDGRWRVSRGFYPVYTEFKCSKCDSGLGVSYKQVRTGFKCPKCQKAYATYRGEKDVVYRAVKSFDVTVTDRPAMPFTSASAILSKEFLEMTKEELKEKLLAAGLSEDVVQQKMATLNDEELKELKDIPEAAVLKEEAPAAEPVVEEKAVCGVGEKPKADEEDEDEEEMTKEELTAVIDSRIVESLKETKFDLKLAEHKEFADMVVAVEKMTTEISTLIARIEKLEALDTERVKELQAEMPRNAAARVMRFKSTVEQEKPVEKEKTEGAAVIKDAEGKAYESVTSFLLGAK